MNNFITPQQTPMVFTYQDILKMYSDQFLGQLLTISIIVFLFDVYVIYYTKDWNLPSWKEVSEKNNPKLWKAKILKGLSNVCFPITLYYLIIIIGIKTGWYV